MWWQKISSQGQTEVKGLFVHVCVYMYSCSSIQYSRMKITHRLEPRNLFTLLFKFQKHVYYFHLIKSLIVKSDHEQIDTSKV